MSDGLTRLRVGSNRCRCGACGRFFGSVTAFDRHQRLARGDLRCLTDDEMRARGMVRGAAGWWYATAATWAAAGVEGA